MSIEYIEATRRYRFHFAQTIEGKQIRTSKLLPDRTTKSEATKYDIAETKRIFHLHTNPIKNRVLISEAVLEYMTHHLTGKKAGYEIGKELERLQKYYEGRYMDEITEIGINFRKAESQLSPATIKNKLSYLRAACKYAQKERLMGDSQLSLHVSMPTVDNARHVYISREEMIKIARACRNRTARAVLRVAFYSGMRISEVVRAGENVEKMKEKGFLLTETKNGSIRIAPMHRKIRIVVRKYFPFSYKKRWIQRLIREAMNSVGLEHVVLHDVRHSAASAMINNGVDLFTIGKVLGHKDARSTARYAHLDMSSLDAAVGKIK